MQILIPFVVKNTFFILNNAVNCIENEIKIKLFAMDTFEQKILFDLIDEKLPSHTSLVYELSELLNVSTDSAYRRLRGQTKLSLEEAVLLARKFGLSLDAMFHHTKNSFPFIYRGLNYNVPSLESYYRQILTEFDRIDVMENTRILYATKDVPMFHIFAFPEIAAFRLFFWKKTIYDIEEYKNKDFTLEELDSPILNIGKQMIHKYIKFPSLEIWSDEVISSTINPILYYYESGVIEKRSLALHLLDRIDEFLDHIKRQAELGGKFLPEHNGPINPGNFEMYYNEVTLTNNTIILESGKKKYAYLIQNAVDYLLTDNNTFCERTKDWIENLTRKSVKISTQAEKFRRKYFAETHRYVDRIRDRIK